MKYPMIVSKDIPGLVPWKEGDLVDAVISIHRAGEYSITPRGQIGPTSVCIPSEYLQYDRSICTDGQGNTSHDILGDNCIRCGKYFT